MGAGTRAVSAQKVSCKCCSQDLYFIVFMPFSMDSQICDYGDKRYIVCRFFDVVFADNP